MTTKPRFPRSARARIVGAIILLMFLTVGIVIGVTTRLLLVRVERSAIEEISHEIVKFRQTSTGASPVTGRPVDSTREALTDYLATTVAEPSEQIFSIVDGAADRRSSNQSWGRLDTDRDFVARAAQASEPYTGRVTTDAGPAEYAVVPVRVAGSEDRGALVIVEYLQPGFRAVWSTTAVMAAAGGFALLVTGAIGWMVAGRVLAPIRTLRETADAISDSDLSSRIEVTGSDDVAQLATTFNGMLDRLETAFEGQRRFLDDAGHELRTPITIVRGHLAVMGDDAQERAATLRLVEDELRRMSRLVSELIMLARSERPDFLEPGPTDLAELVVETLAKATPLGPRRWGIDALPEGTAYVDGNRLTQALLQLASNAVNYSEENDRIGIGGALEGARLTLWVSDTGAGIPQEKQAGIFGRFARGSVHGHVPGRGLGLAIVARIAAAHGGEVRVRSEPGAGSTFTLDIPLRVPGDNDRQPEKHHPTTRTME